MAHLIALYGVKGDDSLDGTQFKIIDPDGGVKKSLSFRQFGRMYDADDAVNIPFNVFHNI